MIRKANIEGLDFIVQVPDDAEDYESGLVIGPPEILVETLKSSLDSEEIARRLHQELVARDLITYRDVSTRRQDVIGALQSVLNWNAERIIEVYRNGNE